MFPTCCAIIAEAAGKLAHISEFPVLTFPCQKKRRLLAILQSSTPDLTLRVIVYPFRSTQSALEIGTADRTGPPTRWHAEGPQCRLRFQCSTLIAAA